MATEPAAVVHQLLHDMDNLNFDAISGYFTKDVQSVDEISRRWIRGSAELAGYLAQLQSAVTSVTSQLNDVHEVMLGDTALVTCWLEQSYVLDGATQKVSAPTTTVLRREDGDWKVALLHSIPLPPDD